VLGSGFDPGVTNVYCAYAQKHLFDEIHTSTSSTATAATTARPSPPTSTPRSTSGRSPQRGRYWEKGEWKETDPLSVSMMFDFPGVGGARATCSTTRSWSRWLQNLKGLERIRFWMTFGESYLKHLEVLQNVGMTRIDEVDYQGTQQIVPISS
jgi:saccharopine dehydrogenase (NAD+, L-lysine-forming)